MKIIKKAWKKWLEIGRIIGNFNFQVILTIFYFFILWMIGFFVRYFSDPLLVKKTKRTSNFLPWEHSVENIAQAKNQY